MTRVRMLFTALLALLPLVASCASIPEYSDPKAARPVSGGDDRRVPEVPSDLDPLGLVRNFVTASANPGGDYAAARKHLTRQASASWDARPGVQIIDNEFGTIYPGGTGPHGDTATVLVRAKRIGRLESDKSFTPESGEIEVPFQVRRERGQWRLAAPPPDVLVQQREFSENYTQVPVYFLDQERSGVVPDLRYVASQPASALPGQVVNMLIGGPSTSLRDAVRSALPPGVDTQTNVSEAEDGALVVNLTRFGDPPLETRRLIAAQVVLSVQSVSNARVRLLVGGSPLVPDHPEWRRNEVVSYEARNAPRQDLPGMVAVSGRIRELDERAAAISGPAGSGEYDVVDGARSSDGSRLAAVVRNPGGGVALRIGRFGQSMREVPLHGSTMTRPTWRGDDELWTVVDGHTVVRLLDNGDGTWTPQRVDVGRFAGTAARAASPGAGVPPESSPDPVPGETEPATPAPTPGPKAPTPGPNPGPAPNPGPNGDPLPGAAPPGGAPPPAPEPTGADSPGGRPLPVPPTPPRPDPPITDLRLSQDGSRIAGVVGGHVVVGGVVPDRGEMGIRHPYALNTDPQGSNATALDWASADSLVVASDSTTTPVTRVQVNGFISTPYSSSNLTQPVTAVAATPGRGVVVADGTGLWQTPDERDLWRPIGIPGGWRAEPFFPG